MLRPSAGSISITARPKLSPEAVQIIVEMKPEFDGWAGPSQIARYELIGSVDGKENHGGPEGAGRTADRSGHQGHADQRRHAGADFRTPGHSRRLPALRTWRRATSRPGAVHVRRPGAVQIPWRIRPLIHKPRRGFGRTDHPACGNRTIRLCSRSNPPCVSTTTSSTN